jgi:molybdenum cofactor sulfurtransferase
MSQKRYPRMALIRPRIDLNEALLHVSFADPTACISPIAIPLYLDPSSPLMSGEPCSRSATVCGDRIQARTYQNPDISGFFTKALGVPCQLCRFPAGGGGSEGSKRHSKPHLQPSARHGESFVDKTDAAPRESTARPILLSNESPVLTISRSSLNRLNEQIKSNGGKAVRADVFRANIVLAEDSTSRPGQERPYAEDDWRMIRVGDQFFEFLGPCRRCQMVCIDQDTGQRNAEPFSTLAKTRRHDGKVFFGQHTCHVPANTPFTSLGYPSATIAVGDLVTAVA